MEISANIEGSKATLVLEGKLTVQTAPELAAAVDALDPAPCDFDLDLTDVEYVSSAGLRVFVATDQLAVSRGGVMRILHPNDDVMAVFDMTGLVDIFNIER